MSAGRITVRWANVNHRFLSNVEVTLAAGSSPIEPVLPPGKRKKPRPGALQFDVDPLAGSLLTLRVRVLPPERLKDRPEFTRPLLELEQAFHIEGEATAVPDNPADVWHPRVRPTTAAGAGKSAVVGLELDLSFLDVTAYFFATRVPEIERALFRNPKDHTAIKDGAEGFLPDDFEGCNVRLLQHTGGVPGVVAVLIPPAVTASDHAVDGVLFQKPADSAYKTIDDVSLFSIARYITAYGDGAAWHNPPQVDHFGRVEDDPWFGHYHPTLFVKAPEDDKKPAAKVNPPSHPVASLPNDRVDWGFGAYPRTRLAQQLARSNRKAVVAIPVANRFDYGVTAGSNIRSIWLSLFACLQGDGHIGDGSRAPVTLRKLALNGFSAGAVPAYACLRTNEKAVDEVWLWDPIYFLSNSRALVAWYNADKEQRRLRIIGGEKLRDIYKIRKEIDDEEPWNAMYAISNPSNASIWPREHTFFRYSQIYALAHATSTDEKGPWTRGLRCFDTITEAELQGKNVCITTPAIGEPTKRTNIREVIRDSGKGVRDDALYVVAILPNGTPTHMEEFVDFSSNELAEALRRWEDTPIQTARQLRDTAQRIRSKFANVLHQWPAFGGQSIGQREHPDYWAGYFELCLRFSSFLSLPEETPDEEPHHKKFEKKVLYA